MGSPGALLTALNVDGFHQQSAQLIKGYANFLDLSGAWAENVRLGLHYFGIQYRTHSGLSFTDCRERYDNNKNLYAMMLSPTCRAITVNPKGGHTLPGGNKWSETDVAHTFKLTKNTHVIIMYQYSGYSANTHIVMRLNINTTTSPDIKRQTISVTGDTAFVGNFGLWQGVLGSGTYRVVLEFRSPTQTVNNVSPNLDWSQVFGSTIWHSRALTVITC